MAQNLEIISKNFQFSTKRTMILMGSIISTKLLCGSNRKSHVQNSGSLKKFEKYSVDCILPSLQSAVFDLSAIRCLSCLLRSICNPLSLMSFEILTYFISSHLIDRKQDLKRIKKQKMKDIIKAMEAFNDNLVGGKRLVKVRHTHTHKHKHT